MLGLFPPNSSVHCLRLDLAAATWMSLPTWKKIEMSFVNGRKLKSLLDCCNEPNAGKHLCPSSSHLGGTSEGNFVDVHVLG